MLQVEWERTGTVNVFWLAGDLPKHKSIYGAVFDPSGKRWVYPAYAPVGHLVLLDLAQLYPNVPFSPAAASWAAYLRSLPDRVAARELPNPNLPVKPFDHQLEGLAYLYHNPRWALLWEPGVGKTKVLCDLKLQLPGSRMLVLCPLVVIDTWMREVAFHSRGALRAAAITGTPERKKKIIRDHKDYDMLITTYGTARTMGHPTVAKDAMRVLQDTGRRDIGAAGRVIARLNAPKQQVALATKWAEGAPLAEIENEVRQSAGAAWLCDIDYDVIVADESHYIKEMRSKQTKAALALSTKAERRYIMSGTAALGNPCDLYPQLRFLAPSLMPEDWFNFCNKFLIRRLPDKRILGYQNLHIINQRVDRIAIRKRKDECLDLPDRTIVDVMVRPSPQQISMYNDLVIMFETDLQEYLTTRGESGVIDAASVGVVLNKIAQVLSGFIYKRGELVQEAVPVSEAAENDENTSVQMAVKEQPPEVIWLNENPKLDALREILDSLLLDPTHKVIVWAVFSPELDSIAGLLEKEGLGYVRLDGKTSSKASKLIPKFNEDPACRVLLGQIGTGVGFTANAAAYTVYYSLDWSLDKYLQSLDRNYRAGQTKKITVYRILCEGSVDRLKAMLLDQKKRISKWMTEKAACIQCDRNLACATDGIELFGPRCKYTTAVIKLSATPKPLEEGAHARRARARGLTNPIESTTWEGADD